MLVSGDMHNIFSLREYRPDGHLNRLKIRHSDLYRLLKYYSRDTTITIHCLQHLAIRHGYHCHSLPSSVCHHSHFGQRSHLRWHFPGCAHSGAGTSDCINVGSCPTTGAKADAGWAFVPIDPANVSWLGWQDHWHAARDRQLWASSHAWTSRVSQGKGNKWFCDRIYSTVPIRCIVSLRVKLIFILQYFYIGSI